MAEVFDAVYASLHVRVSNKGAFHLYTQTLGYTCVSSLIHAHTLAYTCKTALLLLCNAVCVSLTAAVLCKHHSAMLQLPVHMLQLHCRSCNTSQAHMTTIQCILCSLQPLYAAGSATQSHTITQTGRTHMT